MSWSDVAPSIRAVLTASAEQSVKITLRGIERPCWRCGTLVRAPALLHRDDEPDVDANVDASIYATSDVGLRYAHDLLVSQNHVLASAVKVRYSRARRESYLSTGCSRCDALAGEFFLSDEIMGVQANGRTSELPTLLVAERPIIEWWALVCDRNNMWTE